MGTSAYPGGIDSYSVPTEPESTPLSSAGSATRNHTELLDAHNAAIVAIETNAALKGHDHGGDGTAAHGNKLVQANTHESPDTDTALTALHHTLGTGANQAATGNHTHDYNGTTIINKPYIVCTSLTRPTTTYEGLQIFETDTGRVRMWSSYQGNTVSTTPRLFSTENFNYTNTNGVNSSDWSTWYSNPGKGHFAVDGANLVWSDDNTMFTQTNRGILQRINSADRHLLTDDPTITFQTGTEPEVPFLTDQVWNDYFVRMSDDGQCYWRVSIGWGVLQVYYTTSGPSGEQQFGQFWGETRAANVIWTIQFSGRNINIYRNGGFFQTFRENDGLGQIGPSYRGWAVGMQAAGALLTQVTPAKLNYITVQDATTLGSSARWTLMSVGAIPVVSLLQGTAQQIQPAGTAIEWRTKVEDSFGYFNSANSLTDVNILEPGLYTIMASVAWNLTGIFSDHAATIINVNGLDTPKKHWEFIRGNTFTPGFSQNVDVMATMRFAANDVLRIKAAHNGGLAQYTYSSTSDKQDTHLDLFYLGP